MGYDIYNICPTIYIYCQSICTNMKKFEVKGVINRVNTSLTLEESKQVFEELVKSILCTRRGLQYLLLKYPNLSIEAAINEFKAQASLAEQQSC